MPLVITSTPAEEAAREARRHAEPGGGVLHVGDHQVDLELAPEAREGHEGPAAGLAEHVPDAEDVQRFHGHLPSVPDGRAARSLARELGGAVLPDHGHLDVTGVLHLGLDPLGDVLGQLVGVEVEIWSDFVMIRSSRPAWMA